MDADGKIDGAGAGAGAGAAAGAGAGADAADSHDDSCVSSALPTLPPGTDAGSCEGPAHTTSSRFEASDKGMCKWWATKSSAWGKGLGRPDLQRFLRAWWKCIMTSDAVSRLSKELHATCPALRVGAFACVRNAALYFHAQRLPAGEPLKPFLPMCLDGGGGSPDASFPALFEDFVSKHYDAVLSTAVAGHGVYQMNVPQRLHVVALGAAVATRCWPRDVDVAHVDVGTATGIGTLLSRCLVSFSGKAAGEVQLTSRPDLEPLLRYRGSVLLHPERHGSEPPPWLRDLSLPRIVHRFGAELLPVDLTDDHQLQWARACQPLLSREAFSCALDVLRDNADDLQIIPGDAVKGIKRVHELLPPHVPLLVTDTVAVVYFGADALAEFLSTLDAIAGAGRPLAWVSFDQLTPMGTRGKSLVTGGPPPIPREDALSRAYLTVTSWLDDTGERPGCRRQTQVLGYAEVQGNIQLQLL